MAAARQETARVAGEMMEEKIREHQEAQMSDEHLSWLKESAQVRGYRVRDRQRKGTLTTHLTSPPPLSLLSHSLLSQVGGKLDEAFQKFLTQTSKVLGAQKAVVEASQKQTQLVRDATGPHASPDDAQSMADTAGSKRESFIL